MKLKQKNKRIKQKIVCIQKGNLEKKNYNRMLSFRCRCNATVGGVVGDFIDLNFPNIFLFHSSQ